VIPISLRPVISKMARDRDSVLMGHHLPPKLYIKAVKRFTWRIYALSECILHVVDRLAVAYTVCTSRASCGINRDITFVGVRHCHCADRQANVAFSFLLFLL